MRWLALVLPVIVIAAACSVDSTPPLPIAKATTISDAGTTTETPSSIVDSGTTTATPVGDDDDDHEPPEEHAGEATYYAATSTGACGIKTPSDKLVGAIAASMYSKELCGQCAEVTGPRGSVVVLLNDRCVGCKSGSLDLATQAFVHIADKSAGRVKITWHLTDCP